MLDLGKVTLQIQDMTSARKMDSRQWTEKKQKAQGYLQEYDEQPSQWKEKIDSDTRHFFVAFPQGRLRQAFGLSEELGAHTVIAVDGSQIEMDTHGAALCFLLNVGRVVLHYGTLEKPLLDSIPRLFFKDEELYQEHNGESLLVQGDMLAELRSRMEVQVLTELVQAHHHTERPTLALADGTLVSWDKSASAKKDIGGFTSPHFKPLFELGERLGIPAAGYISGSRAALVVNTLRAKDCVQPVMNCSSCPYRQDREAPCRELQGLRDATLFQSILQPGERSVVFYGGINSLERKKWPKYRIGFFYVHVGEEVARVEAPDYVLENGRLLEILHRGVYEQARKGMGYPVALQEAHHFAVVKGEERELFYQLVERSFVRAGLSGAVTPKKLYKQNRIY